MAETDHVRAEALAAFIAQARWFGGKGRSFRIGEMVVLPLSGAVASALVRVEYDEPVAGHASDLYQLPLIGYPEPEERLEHALIGAWGGLHHYDAVHDREAMRAWLEGFAGVRVIREPRVEFRRIDAKPLDLDAQSALFSGEQSNSSVAFGEDSLLKIFRRVTPGANPDIEIHEALTRAGNTHIAALYGYVAAGPEAVGADPDGPELQLAMLQQFLRTASDGWELAMASVRNLLTEGDLHADEVGGDFAGEAHRLGATLGEIHTVLHGAFGAATVAAPAVGEAMSRRLREAVAAAPELERHVAGLTRRFRALADLGEIPAQRVHGDLHLGQTLRTSLGWKLVDFEGEPAKDLAERRLPDSPWRDVAGMIRSLHYAAAVTQRDLDSGELDAAQMAYRAGEWAQHNTAALLEGYTSARAAGLSEPEQILLDAYIADKAVYEAVYEKRNRPAWVDIPLAALDNLTRGI